MSEAPKKETKTLDIYLDDFKTELTSIKDNFADYEKNTTVMDNTKNLLNSLYTLVDGVLTDETKKKKLKLTEITTLKKSDLETFINQVDKLKNLEIELNLATLEAKYTALTTSKKEVDDLKKQVTTQHSTDSQIKELDLTSNPLMSSVFGNSVQIDLADSRSPKFKYTDGSGVEQTLNLELGPTGKYYYFVLDSKTYRIKYDSTGNVSLFEEKGFQKFFRTRPLGQKLAKLFAGSGGGGNVADLLTKSKAKIETAKEGLGILGTIKDLFSVFK